ncbi:MAG: YihY family inner membrane protein [Pseudomonadaceae bacterium]|nr:YihY family inner membrane protein [Pseudomonadaceae bacterium]
MENSAETATPRSLVTRFKTHVWHRDLADMSRARRLLARSVRILTQIAKDIWEGQLTLRAMSLVYTTLLSLVPLLAISFSVLKGFGVHREIEPFLITFLAPLGDKAEEIALRFVEFIDNTSVSVLGYVGFGMLFYAVISLMQKIERAFNFVWHVEHDRSFSERVRDYLTLIFVGPTLMVAATGIWATIMNTSTVETLAGVAPLGWMLDLATRAIPIALVIFTFTFVYTFVPNIKVHWRPALVGGVISGLLWNAGGLGFAAFVGNSGNYSAIYSGFATAIFFMIWLYVAWMILLIGCSISFYIQNPFFASQQSVDMSIRMREKLAFAIAALIGKRYYQGQSPLSVDSIADRMAVPAQLVESVLEPMEAEQLVIRTQGKDPGYVPARSWESIPISDLITCIRRHDESIIRTTMTMQNAHASSMWDSFEEGLTSGVVGYTLKDLAGTDQQK